MISVRAMMIPGKIGHMVLTIQDTYTISPCEEQFNSLRPSDAYMRQ